MLLMLSSQPHSFNEGHIGGELERSDSPWEGDLDVEWPLAAYCRSTGVASVGIVVTGGGGVCPGGGVRVGEVGWEVG